MGTHPIFESDFDCLTDCCEGRNYVGLLKNETSAKRENQTQTVNDVTFAQLGF